MWPAHVIHLCERLRLVFACDDRALVHQKYLEVGSKLVIKN
jgi:hypothetical protein